MLQGDSSGNVPASAGAEHDPSGRADAPPSPRAALAAELAAHVARLLAAGDVEAARVAGDAMVRLLGPEAGQGAPVVDLAAERRKRER